jgi:hypothetical protein
MQELNLFKIFTARLTELKLNYFITGSIASIIYGEPRLTHDIDIVLEITLNDIDSFIAAFPKEQFYVPPKEIIKNELLRTERGHFNLIHHESGFKADIFLVGRNKFQKWALKNKKEVPFQGTLLYIAPIEYVIIKKLEYYKEGLSEKHINDIKGMLQNSKDIIDFKIVDRFSKQFGLTDIWDEVKHSGY